MTRDLVIEAAVPIAVRDFGGRGADLLLLHGSGGNRSSMPGFTEALAERHRVVAVDLRGHGSSGDGPWTAETVLGDLATVTAELELDAPAVVGMSLGGMLAARWAAARPGCRGAISLDGNPTPTRPDQLPGLTNAEAELARLHETFATMQSALAASGLRPGPRTVEALRLFQQLDLLPVYQAARCPLLLVQATEDLPQMRPFHPIYAAYRTWLATRLAELDNPHVHVEHLPGASHAMIAEQPGQVIALINDFL